MRPPCPPQNYDAAPSPATAQRVRAWLLVAWEEHYEEIFLYVALRVRNHHLAEDIASTTFVNALRWLLKHEDHLARIANCRGWLMRIAKHALMSHHRRKSHHTLSLHDGVAEGEGAADFDVPDVNATAGDEQLITKEQLAALGQCIDDLAEPGRSLVMQRYLQGIPFHELVARSAEMPGNIASRLHRAVKRIRQCVERRIGLHAQEQGP